MSENENDDFFFVEVEETITNRRAMPDEKAELIATPSTGGFRLTTKAAKLMGVTEGDRLVIVTSKVPNLEALDVDSFAEARELLEEKKEEFGDDIDALKEFIEENRISVTMIAKGDANKGQKLSYTAGRGKGGSLSFSTTLAWTDYFKGNNDSSRHFLLVAEENPDAGVVNIKGKDYYIVEFYQEIPKTERKPAQKKEKAGASEEN